MEAIYATDSNNGLSKNGTLPWNSKKDLKFFMNMTINNVVIMGKNTYFSLPKRPLKDRLNIILTRKSLEPFHGSNIIFTSDDKIIEDIINNREKYSTTYPSLNKNFKIFIIGGRNIYEQFIPLCEKVWITRIKQNYDCDLSFYYDFSKQFKEEIIDEDDELKIIKYEKF